MTFHFSKGSSRDRSWYGQIPRYPTASRPKTKKKKLTLTASRTRQNLTHDQPRTGSQTRPCEKAFDILCGGARDRKIYSTCACEERLPCASCAAAARSGFNRSRYIGHDLSCSTTLSKHLYMTKIVKCYETSANGISRKKKTGIYSMWRGMEVVPFRKNLLQLHHN